MVAVACEVFVDAEVKFERRKVNNLAPELKPVHDLLERWGRLKHDKGVQGYPTQSPTEKAALYGSLGIPQQSSVRIEPELPNDLAAVDAAVCRLGDIDRRVIEINYTNWLPLPVMARKAHMRERQFANVLNRARWRILGFVEAAIKTA